jgi:hypothetical protein
LQCGLCSHAAERSKPLDTFGKTRLAELEREVEYITKKKEKYVAEHPEHRDLVYKPYGKKEALGDEEEDEKALYKKDGRLRDPTRSVYYDAVLNPYGVPPPGMPYRERSESSLRFEEKEHAQRGGLLTTQHR